MARSKGQGGRSRAAQAASRALTEAQEVLRCHPLLHPLVQAVRVHRTSTANLCPSDGWAVVLASGEIHAHPTRHGTVKEWEWVLSHCYLHLGFGHLVRRSHPLAWNAACDLHVAWFLETLWPTAPPEGILLPPELAGTREEVLYERFQREGVPPEALRTGTAGHHPDLVLAVREERFRKPVDHAALLAAGVEQAVQVTVALASGLRHGLDELSHPDTPARLARRWFMSSYPLLGALASAFELVEDVIVCQRLGVTVAAVDVPGRRILVSRAAGLAPDEARFVVAHELLHVGLRHDQRSEGRDPFLWNVACDFVINGWLLEMGIGSPPAFGLLHDPELKGESAESVYDRLVTDLRRSRKLATLRGFGRGDILGADDGPWPGIGVDLDEFCRRALAEGLEYHTAGRGLLPAGLVEEIRALGQPPVPWDVELARWFDRFFAPVERRRTYARASRRQASTPDIPRPRWVLADGALDGRTFGVVLDTSGSMDRALLASALGAIASYGLAREVPAVRVVFCDAAAYDQGYLPPEDIARVVKIRGRGGTVLQPGIDLLERAKDFPADGPILIITDGQCDHFQVRREHALLLPEGARLPFTPRGTVFRLR